MGAEGGEEGVGGAGGVAVALPDTDSPRAKGGGEGTEGKRTGGGDVGQVGKGEGAAKAFLHQQGGVVDEVVGADETKGTQGVAQPTGELRVHARLPGGEEGEAAEVGGGDGGLGGERVVFAEEKDSFSNSSFGLFASSICLSLSFIIHLVEEGIVAQQHLHVRSIGCEWSHGIGMFPDWMRNASLHPLRLF